MKNNRIDFLAIGFNDAVKLVQEIIKKANDIETNYGVNFKEEYEYGVEMVIYEYKNLKAISKAKLKLNQNNALSNPIKSEELHNVQSENIDFLSIGFNDAVKLVQELIKKANAINEQYGLLCKDKYDCGVSMIVTKYDSLRAISNAKLEDDLEQEKSLNETEVPKQEEPTLNVEPQSTFETSTEQNEIETNNVEPTFNTEPQSSFETPIEQNKVAETNNVEPTFNVELQSVSETPIEQNEVVETNNVEPAINNETPLSVEQSPVPVENAQEPIVLEQDLSQANPEDQMVSTPTVDNTNYEQIPIDPSAQFNPLEQQILDQSVMQNINPLEAQTLGQPMMDEEPKMKL